MAQLGKCARATPRQPAGRVARGPADLGSESGLTERRTLPDRRASECAFPSRRDRRLRFSVECAFPHLGKRRAASRKGALWSRRLTEKHALPPAPHGKAHSTTCASRKSALWPDRLTGKRTLRSPGRADCAFPSRCGAREVWGNPPPGCGALWRMPQLGKCARATPRRAAGRVAPGSADLGLSLTSRKSAFCPTGGLQNALFRHDATADCAFP